jgi:hypothetical protein
LHVGNDVGGRQGTDRVFAVVSGRRYSRTGEAYIRDEKRSLPRPRIGQRQDKVDMISCQIAEQGRTAGNVPQYPEGQSVVLWTADECNPPSGRDLALELFWLSSNPTAGDDQPNGAY